MSETLELKARRIGDDITAVWDEIRAKGGMIPHSINTENLIDVLKQTKGIDKWGAHGAFFYTPDGFYDFYTTHEVNRMEQLPDAPAGLSWRISLADLKTRLANNTYVVVASDGTYAFDTSLHMVMTDSNYLTAELYIDVDGHPEDVEILWGDGEISVAQVSGPQFFTHTYASTGTYDLAFKVNGDTDIVIKPHRNNSTPETAIGGSYSSNMFGKCFSSSSPNNIGAKIFGYITSAIIGPKTEFESGAFHPGVHSYNAEGVNSSNLTNVFYTYNPTALVPFTGSAITEYVMPNSAEHFTNTEKFNYCGPFTMCTGLTSVTPSENFHTVPTYCFYKTNLSVFDFSHIEKIFEYSFRYVPLVDTVDMSNVVEFVNVEWGILTDNNTTKEIRLNHGATYDESHHIGNRNSSNSTGMFQNLSALETINIPTDWVALPLRFIYGSDVDISTLVYPHSLEYICYGALTTKKFASLASVLSVLPSTVKFISGLGVTTWDSNRQAEDMTGVQFPAAFEELGGYAFGNRVLKNLTLPSTLYLRSYALSDLRLPEDVFHVPSTWTFETYQSAFNNAYIHKIVLEGTSALFQNAFQSCHSDEISFASGANPTNLNGAFCYASGYSHSTMKLTVPSSVVTLNAYEFGSGLSPIVFEGQVPNIPSWAFSYLSSNGTVIDMSNCTTVPTVTNTSFGTSYVDRAEVIVPDALYASWIADSGWADLITNRGLNVVKASEA